MLTVLVCAIVMLGGIMVYVMILDLRLKKLEKSKENE
jgi:hypothetical protein